MDCTCAKCSAGCETRPGWLAPGELDALAAFLGISARDVFVHHLAVDYFYEDGDVRKPIFVLIPASVDGPKGAEVPFDPRGHCVYYQEDGRCGVHAVKPDECRFFDHARTRDELAEHRAALVRRWKRRQTDIADLLRREPRAPVPTAEDHLALIANNAKYERFRAAMERDGYA